MSVNRDSESTHKYQLGNSPQEQLLKNIMIRMDTLENRHLRPLLSTSSGNERVSGEQIEKIRLNMKIIVNSNMENLKRLEQSTKQNWNDLVDMMRNLENKFVRALKEKQDAMEFLEYRVVSVQSSQKNVTEFMKRMAEQEAEKYSGVHVIEQRMKQVEHIFQLKDKKQSESLKIMQEALRMSTNKKIKEMEQKISYSIQADKKQSNDTGVYEQKIEEMKNKIKMLELDAKQNKRKNLSIEQSFNSIQQEVSKFQKKIETIQRQIKDIERTEPGREQKTTNFKTQNVQRGRKLQTEGHNTAPKSTEQSYLKPSSLLPPKNTLPEPKKSNYDLGNDKSRPASKSNSRAGSNSRRQSHQEEDEDPFQAMGAGIRGLLRKSKQKEEKKISSNNDLSKKPLPRQTKLGQLSHQGSPRQGRNLPPVRADPKLQNKLLDRNQEPSEQEQQVYQVDEDGYLIDEDGNYFYDENGNPIQISEEEMYNIMEENS